MTVIRITACVFSIFFLLSLASPTHPPLFASSSNDKIPDAIVALSSGYAIVVDKKDQKLFVFKKNGSFSKVFETNCSTGKNSGAKMAEGDGRTPEGVFFITRIAPNPGPPETYGSLALPLDFPNLVDQKVGRNGTNIWIHGTTAPLVPFQSNGCIVLKDPDMIRLRDFVHLYKTPVIVTESIRWVDQSYQAPAKGEFERILTAWNQAFISGNFEAIDQLYFEGTLIRNQKRSQLVRQMRQAQSHHPHFMLNPRDVSILQYEDAAVILFDQVTSIKRDNSFEGFYNRLSLKRIDNQWYVIDEVPQRQIAQVSPPPEPVKPQLPSSAEHDAIRRLVATWSESWQSGNMTAYRNCYTPGFQSRNMNLNQWVQNKEDIRKRSRNIRVSVDHLRINVDGNRATATFTQRYQSSILNSRGVKRLDLVKSGSSWRIHREVMQ